MRSKNMRQVLVMLLLVSVSSIGLASYTSVVEADNPTGYWKFEETSGTTAADEIAGQTADYRGNPTLGVEGADGNGVELPGINYNYASVPATASLLPVSGSFTMEAWIKISTTATQRICSWMGARTDGSNAGIYSIIWGAGGAKTITFQTRYSNGTGLNELATGTIDLSDSEWHQVVAVYDRDNNQKLIYIDGSLAVASTGLTLGDIVVGHTPANMYLGAYAAGQNVIDGTMDEISVYKTALSATQIENHYNAIPEPATMSFVAVGGLFAALRRRKK